LDAYRPPIAARAKVLQTIAGCPTRRQPAQASRVAQAHGLRHNPDCPSECV